MNSGRPSWSRQTISPSRSTTRWHHAQVGCVPFHGAAWLRPVYLGLLVPHIVLAALVVPLALTTIYRAWRGHFDRHRRLARVTLPIWLYVSVSGVLVYVLLYDARSLRRNGRRRRVLVPLPIGGRRAALNGGDDEKAALRVEVEEDAPVPEAPTIGPERLFRELEAVAGGGRLAHLLDGGEDVRHLERGEVPRLRR